MSGRPLRLASLALACALLAPACGSGKSIIVAGNDTPTATTVVVPPATQHGFENTSEAPLLVVSVHDSGEMQQRFLDE